MIRSLSIIVFLTSIYASANPYNYVEKEVEWSFYDLKEAIELHEIDSIGSLLPLLPKSYLYSYTLMHSSRSLHETSARYSRAILFGSTGQLILTFNGSPEQRGYESLEILSFENNKAEFREIIFRGDYQKAKEGSLDTATTPFDELSVGSEDFDPSQGGVLQKDLLMTKPNPSRCMSCHGVGNNMARPIYENYPRWLTAFGSEDDRIWDPYGVNGGHHLYSDNNIFWQFKDNAKAHHRYKHLVYEVDGNDHFPYYAYNGYRSDLYTGERIYEFMPNLRLTSLLGIRYASQLAEQVMLSSFYQQNRTQIWMSICDPSSETASSLKKKVAWEHSPPRDQPKEYLSDEKLLVRKILAASGIPDGNTSMELGYRSFPETSFPGLALRYTDWPFGNGIDALVINLLVHMEGRSRFPHLQQFLADDLKSYREAYYSIVPPYSGDPDFNSVMRGYYDMIFPIKSDGNTEINRHQEVCDLSL